MYRRIISIIICLTVFYPVAKGQVVFSSLEDMWQYAEEHNMNVRTARYETDKSRIAKQQAYSALLPQVVANGSYVENTALQTTLIPAVIFGGPADVYQPVQFGQRYIYAGGFTAQMDILNPQSWYNVNIARVTESYNRATAANTKKSIYQQVANQYYAYLLMQEAARLATQSERIADSVLQAVTNKYKEGNVNEANVDLAKINLERAQQNMITAEYQIQTAKNNLKSLLGLTIRDSILITATLQRTQARTTSTPFSEDPSIRQAYYQTKIGLSQYTASKGAFLPTLSVLYSNTTQQNNNTFEPLQGGAAWYPAKYWSLRASWTVFGGGSKLLQTKKTRMGYEQSMEQYENAKNQAAINDENLKLAYRKSAALLEKAEHVMKLSYDNYMHISNRYEAGIEPLTSRLNAFTDYINYQNQYLNSLSDMLVQMYQVKIRQHSF